MFMNTSTFNNKKDPFKELSNEWWDENGDDYDDYDSPYDIDPTPQYLYDDTGGEPPISAEERRDAEFRKKYGWA